MSKYQTSTMGLYAHMLTEDIAHAVVGEYRTEDGWEEDPERDPVEEATEAARELSHHLFQAMAHARNMEKLTNFKIGRNGVTMAKYAESQAAEERDMFENSDWAWLYDED